MLGADVVVSFLRSWGQGPAGGQLNELHELVAGKLAGTPGMAEFDAECRTPRGPTGWSRDRVQHAVARAMAQDGEFAGRVRALLKLMGAEDSSPALSRG